MPFMKLFSPFWQSSPILLEILLNYDFFEKTSYENMIVENWKIGQKIKKLLEQYRKIWEKLKKIKKNGKIEQNGQNWAKWT